ncbi:hypothetical protein PIB30_091228 [Stylosanthes scabra]|uniref:Uncharacterized protein n=1 Tax=Stylosanthes scabra TaxID=79078 RepID=A0ABU6WXA9_9FABA|nr:hypothetical protein [Stylosanthes scabra]
MISSTRQPAATDQLQSAAALRMARLQKGRRWTSVREEDGSGAVERGWSTKKPTQWSMKELDVAKTEVCPSVQPRLVLCLPAPSVSLGGASIKPNASPTVPRLPPVELRRLEIFIVSGEHRSVTSLVASDLYDLRLKEVEGGERVVMVVVGIAERVVVGIVLCIWRRKHLRKKTKKKGRGIFAKLESETSYNERDE